VAAIKLVIFFIRAFEINMDMIRLVITLLFRSHLI